MQLDTVVCGDCLDVMRDMEMGSVDAIITDLPYGTTQCEWDSIIPPELMWPQVKRVLKPCGAFITTASQPFTSFLITSNLAWFRYELIWEKQHPKGFLDARRKPLNSHEGILIFCEGLTTYNPQGTLPVHIKSSRKNKGGNGVYGRVSQREYIQTEGNFPRSVLRFDALTNGHVHPTQKPVPLYEYLIKTYTNEGDTVLDFALGSGTTAIAAIKTGRHFYGCDINAAYVELANQRIAKARAEMAQLEMDLA